MGKWTSGSLIQLATLFHFSGPVGSSLCLRQLGWINNGVTGEAVRRVVLVERAWQAGAVGGSGRGGRLKRTKQSLGVGLVSRLSCSSSILSELLSTTSHFFVFVCYNCEEAEKSSEQNKNEGGGEIYNHGWAKRIHQFIRSRLNAPFSSDSSMLGACFGRGGRLNVQVAGT